MNKSLSTYKRTGFIVLLLWMTRRRESELVSLRQWFLSLGQTTRKRSGQGEGGVSWNSVTEYDNTAENEGGNGIVNGRNICRNEEREVESHRREGTRLVSKR